MCSISITHRRSAHFPTHGEVQKTRDTASVSTTITLKSGRISSSSFGVCTSQVTCGLICINQQDDEEKGFQVAMMSRIYASCETVIVWLGRNSPKFRRAADDFQHKPRMKSLSLLLCDRYFTRLWIVQEVLLARKVRVICRGMSGAVELSWESMREIATSTVLWLQERGHPRRVIALFARQGTIMLDQRHLKPLSWCIERFSGYRCWDPRDRVFALLGLVRERERIPVDYERPLEDTFLDVVRVLYREYQTRPREERIYGETYRRALDILASNMGFEDIDRHLQGLRNLLCDVFSHGTTSRARRLGLYGEFVITDMGFHPADPGDEDTAPHTGHWWFRAGGNTCTHNCCHCSDTRTCYCDSGRSAARWFSAMKKWTIVASRFTGRRKWGLTYG
jgi:hypothetical protein